jgi:hypothetical protein
MEPFWKAGVARAVITPAEPMWLAGWAVRTEPSRGTLTDLYAKALVLEDAQGSRLVLLTVDLIAVSPEIATAVVGQVRQCWGLPPERLLLCASHTHCGPEIRPDKVPFFHIPPEYARKIPPYVSWLTARLVEVVGAALADMQPVHLTARRTTAPFAHNRRGADAVDHDVPVLEVTGADGRRRAVIFGYACHNLTMPPDDGRWCGDYAGYAQADLETDDPAAGALFVAGAGADQNPDPRGTLDLARRHGHTLAEAVRHCLTTPGTGRAITGPLRVAYEEVPLDLQPLPPRDALQADRASDDPPRRTKAEYLLARLDRAAPHPPENLCQLPLPGELLLFYDGPSSVANAKKPVREICFVYNRGVVLRGPEGVPTHGSLFARVPGDWKYDWVDFRNACRKARWDGPQVLRIEQEGNA